MNFKGIFKTRKEERAADTELPDDFLGNEIFEKVHFYPDFKAFKKTLKKMEKMTFG